MKYKCVVLSCLTAVSAAVPLNQSVAARKCQTLFFKTTKAHEICQKLAKLSRQGISLPFAKKEMELIHQKLILNHSFRDLVSLQLSLAEHTHQNPEITRLLVSEIALHLKIEPQLELPREADLAKASVVAGLNSLRIRPIRVWAINQWMNHAGLRRTLIAVDLFPGRHASEPAMDKPIKAHSSDTILMADPPITTVVYAVFKRGPHHVATEVPGDTFHLSDIGGASHPRYFIQDTDAAMADEI